jgi:ribosomal-protein-alanine N-acetyltransferase
MNAVLRPTAPRRVPMSLRHLDDVVAIECQAYAFPWSRGNFIDSLAAGYAAEVLLGENGTPIGYSVAMAGVDEVHLLNITVKPERQRQGWGRLLLDALVADCRTARKPHLLLEVRESNQGAHALYMRYGFEQIGLRRGYYPAPQGQREDAIVMQLAIEAPHGLD